jgi:hypothetical protein
MPLLPRFAQRGGNTLAILARGSDHIDAERDPISTISFCFAGSGVVGPSKISSTSQIFRGLVSALFARDEIAVAFALRHQRHGDSLIGINGFRSFRARLRRLRGLAWLGRFAAADQQRKRRRESRASFVSYQVECREMCRRARHAARCFGNAPKRQRQNQKERAGEERRISSLAMFITAGTRVRPLLQNGEGRHARAMSHAAEPTPPKMLAPPRTTAVMASNS